MRDKIEFPKNVPVELALAYNTGREGANDKGEYFMYTTQDDRVFFATPTLNNKIQALAPAAFERLVVCLKNSRETGGKNIWEVTRVDAEPQALAKPAAGNSAGPNNTRQVNGSSNGNGNGNGHHTPAAASLMTGQSQGMLDQFIAVYEVMTAVEKYAELKGRPLVFTSEDFRATAISCYIAQSRGGR